jgi:hypothetical protein
MAVPSADAAPGWLAPIDISAAGQQAGGPQVAVDRHGDAVAIWDSPDGTGKYGLTAHVEQAAFRPAGGAWQAPERLAWAGESGERPSVGIDGHGDAFAVWEAYTGYTFVVEAAYRPAGGSWEEPVELAPAEIPGAAHPRLAVDEQGDAIAIWNRGGPAGGTVQEAFKPAGGSWQGPDEVAEIGDNPQVAFDDKGDALALWQRYGAEEWFAQSAFKPVGGVWQPPVDVSTGSLAGGLQMAVNAQGDATAVWDQWTNGFLSSRTVQTAFMPTGDAWQTPVTLVGAEDELDQPKGAGEPGIAVDGQGDEVAVWTWAFKGTVQAAFKSAGDAWQTPVNISGADASSPQVAFDGQGDALAAWDSSSRAVEAAFKPAGGAWQAPVDIGNGGGPQVAFDGQGDALAAWTDEGRIQAVGYVGAAPSLNGLSIPTEGTVGQPVTFSVTPFDVWSVPEETSWSFGDGVSANGTSVTHAYTAPGVYEVVIHSADTLGDVASTAHKVTITPAPPTPTPVTPTTAAPILAPTTPTGSTGPAGPAGKNGEIELVTCTTVTKNVKGKKTTSQKCTTKLTSAPAAITTTGASIAAVLSRGKVVYATGSAVVSGKHTKLLLTPRHNVGEGSYTLTLTHGPERLRETIRIE